MLEELTESVKDTIKSAARKLTGFRRRQFQAEMAIKYCQGHPRRAEEVFGWGRDAVNTGLNELRTGTRCLDGFSARGRHKTEEQHPELVSEIHALAEPESQADPKFQTPLAYTRITAKAVYEHLKANAVGENQHVPAERTVHDILNRLGYRLRPVR
jgi:Rhodopirellula transposase DDE domain